MVTDPNVFGAMVAEYAGKDWRFSGWYELEPGWYVLDLIHDLTHYMDTITIDARTLGRSKCRVAYVARQCARDILDNM